jgi:hypothetical protein
VHAVRSRYLHSIDRLHELHELSSRDLRNTLKLIASKLLQLLSRVLLCVIGIGTLLYVLLWFGLCYRGDQLHNPSPWAELHARYVLRQRQF